MNVNQKLKTLMKGDRTSAGKIAKLTGMTSHGVKSKINNVSKEIDSIEFIKACAEVFAKPFSYFIDLNAIQGLYDLENADKQNYEDLEKENCELRGENYRLKEEKEGLRKENDILKSRIIEIQEGLLKMQRKWP